MSPAFEAATHTTVPTVSMAARAEASVQPRARNTTLTPSSVTSAIPDVGLEETPMSPTMREDTTTNVRPKTATPIAATARWMTLISPASSPGTATSITTTRAGNASTTQPGRSRSVRDASGPAVTASGEAPRPRSTATSEAYIVGSARVTVTIPAAATAPAPM
jgi:hypothetical protein